MLQRMEEARGKISSVEEFAAGIVRVVETAMEKAIRVISVERGYDTREFTLVAFGGGGPLHACSLAHALRVPRVMVPQLPGALSAVGILLADTTRDYSRTVMLPITADAEPIFTELEEKARTEFAAEGLDGMLFRSADLRYKGQGYELNVPCGEGMVNAFHALHKKRYGFASEQRPVEIVNVRVRMVSAAEPFTPEEQKMRDGDGSDALMSTRPVFFDGRQHETRIYDRERLHAGDTFAGPAIVSEYSSATILPPGDLLRVDKLGNLIIEVHA
jgi:N-methylhydantoinase A